MEWRLDFYADLWYNLCQSDGGLFRRFLFCFLLSILYNLLLKPLILFAIVDGV